MGQQKAKDRTQTKVRTGKWGNTSRSRSLGMPVAASANNNIASQGRKVYGAQGGTREINPGSKPRTKNYGTTTRKTH